MNKLKVAVLAGGISAEREISLSSGRNIQQALVEGGHQAYLLDPSQQDFDFLQFKEFDVVYPVLHGIGGEDGVIQGVLEFYGLPYVGSNICASAITMDKSFTEEFFSCIGINCPRGFVADRDIQNNLDRIEQIGYPFVVKPLSEGSSIGVKIFHTPDETYQYLSQHLKEYPFSIIEPYIRGREMTVGIFQKQDEIEILPILELAPKMEFCDFKSKYTKGMIDFIIPAHIDNKVLIQIQHDVKRIFHHLRLRDCVRIDLILTDDDIPCYLEVNTSPGMTPTSDIPAMLEAAKIPLPRFVEILCYNALHRIKISES
ncbi:D-alanine-D-alanine ligase [Brevinema andersonii]|uniref:D-alanine--D-alanine ligase n=1 Tax=Brevinema andersonii TaxID=34097 RepID=A0A1I1EJI8_BREAD|nr:D-alanine--D-alanine ligase [Brevinema andersonii]SFB86782.1 D-alanine-D-alanine ligase [Brevinema andersonii]